LALVKAATFSANFFCLCLGLLSWFGLLVRLQQSSQNILKHPKNLKTSRNILRRQWKKIMERERMTGVWYEKFFLCGLACFFDLELELSAGCVHYRLLKSTKVY